MELKCADYVVQRHLEEISSQCRLTGRYEAVKLSLPRKHILKGLSTDCKLRVLKNSLVQDAKSGGCILKKAMDTSVSMFI